MRYRGTTHCTSLTLYQHTHNYAIHSQTGKCKFSKSFSHIVKHLIHFHFRLPCGLGMRLRIRRTLKWDAALFHPSIIQILFGVLFLLTPIIGAALIKDPRLGFGFSTLFSFSGVFKLLVGLSLKLISLKALGMEFIWTTAKNMIPLFGIVLQKVFIPESESITIVLLPLVMEIVQQKTPGPRHRHSQRDRIGHRGRLVWPPTSKSASSLSEPFHSQSSPSSLRLDCSNSETSNRSCRKN